MTRCVYVASSEGQTGKAAVALGLIDALVKAGKSVGVFRPVVKDPQHDEIGAALLAAPGVSPTSASALGVSYEDAHADPDKALAEIVDHYAGLDSEGLDVIVAVGTDWTDVATSTELALNARVAANLNAPVVMVVNAFDRTPEQVRVAADNAVRVFTDEHNTVLAVIANRALNADADAIARALEGAAPFVAVIPEQRVLSAPSVRDQFAAAQAQILNGSDQRLDAESLQTLIAGMTLPNVLRHIDASATVIAAADRDDLIPGLLEQAADKLAALILVGGFEIAPELMERIRSTDLPVAATGEGSFTTASRVARLFGSLSPEQPNKIAAAGPAFAEHVDAAALVRAIDECRAEIRAPLMFEHQLQAMARMNKKTIVLPEAMDDRILRSAAIVAERDFAHVILLGERAEIDERARELGLDLGAVEVISPRDPELLEKFSAKYAELRAKKGVTLEQAREKMADLSYFGTMMIYFGMADGMVSGAVNTTANTIKPSFEFIKTKPGIKVVSSSFLMCLADRVLVFGDCAVNPNPTPEELADIALSSAETAKRFGIEPRVAMLSYSTGTSGKGADVDAVAEATRLAKERAPELKLDGPIQFDAAIDATVGTKKMPGSAVAGQATVFIFPDLNTGNNTYKAVQRSANALAVGPVLQGLNKPVNDLSRGALVDDIVNTVAITAIQAQDDAATEGTK